jgi:glutamine phosphoribosylpyrophosphate amidotransferase
MEHECGILGVCDAYCNNYIIPNLNKLQHRGYQSAGLSYVTDNGIQTFKKLGLVDDVFADFQYHSTVKLCIANVRYSTRKKTSEDCMLQEAQPIIGQVNKTFALAHNGNIPVIDSIKKEYNIDTTNNSDSYILTKLIELLYKKYNNI